MPPKPRFKTEDIVQAAFDVVRKEGWDGLSARSIAKELNASTRPIYSCLQSMKNLEDEVIQKALDLFFQYMTTPRTGDEWIDHGLGYVLFAKEEKHLFRCVNDERHSEMTKEYARKVWAALAEELEDHPMLKDLSPYQREKTRGVRWFMVHGLASLINNGWYSIVDRESIALVDGSHVRLADLIRKSSLALYKGIQETFEEE